MKNYVKEKLNEAIFVAAVVSGRSIVAVKDALAATHPSPVRVWLSSKATATVNQSVVVKWMEANKRRMVSSMWGWDPAAIERIHANIQSADPAAVEEARAKKDAERKIEESGVGECSFCDEEIVKNERESWESDFLLEYCVSARDHRHKPKIAWKVADG